MVNLCPRGRAGLRLHILFVSHVIVIELWRSISITESVLGSGGRNLPLRNLT